jgi:hypothetical protein
VGRGCHFCHWQAIFSRITIAQASLPSIIRTTSQRPNQPLMGGLSYVISRRFASFMSAIKSIAGRRPRPQVWHHSGASQCLKRVRPLLQCMSPQLCRFLGRRDVGLSTRADGRRRRSAKARSRGRRSTLGAAGTTGWRASGHRACQVKSAQPSRAGTAFE